jgi:hypothetical protein
MLDGGECSTQALAALLVACFLPGRAMDLSAPSRTPGKEHRQPLNTRLDAPKISVCFTFRMCIGICHNYMPISMERDIIHTHVRTIKCRVFADVLYGSAIAGQSSLRCV